MYGAWLLFHAVDALMLDHVLDEARSPVKKDMLVNATVLDGFVLSDDIHVASAMYERGTNGASCTALLRPALEGCGRIKWNAACVPIRVQGCRAVAVLREASRSLNLNMNFHTLFTQAYILRRFTTGRLSDETPWLPNKEMTKPCEVSDETSTNLFPHFQCLTLQCDPSTLKPWLGGVWRKLGLDLGGQLGGRQHFPRGVYRTEVYDR